QRAAQRLPQREQAANWRHPRMGQGQRAQGLRARAHPAKRHRRLPRRPQPAAALDAGRSEKSRAAGATDDQAVGHRIGSKVRARRAALAAVTGLAGSLLGMVLAVAPSATAAGCATVRGPFTQHGARIWQARGRLFVPTGSTVSGLERPDWADLTAVD